MNKLLGKASLWMIAAMAVLLAAPEAHAGAWNDLGRFLGFHWSDGYHARPPSGYRHVSPGCPQCGGHPQYYHRSYPHPGPKATPEPLPLPLPTMLPPNAVYYSPQRHVPGATPRLDSSFPLKPTLRRLPPTDSMVRPVSMWSSRLTPYPVTVLTRPPAP